MSVIPILKSNYLNDLELRDQKKQIQLKFLENHYLSVYKEEWKRFKPLIESRIRILCECSFRLFSEIPNEISKHLSGSTFPLSLKLIAEDLSNFKDVLSLIEGDFALLGGIELPVLTRIHSIAINALKLSRFFYKASHEVDREGEVKRLALLISLKIKTLKVGDSTVIPGGYIQKQAGHAALYEVCRSSESRYTFEVFNTGEGAKEYIGTDRLKCAISIQFSDISLKDISARNFWEQLICFTVIDSDASSMEEVLSCIRKHLGNSKEGLGAIYELQYRNSCSFKAPMAWIQSKLSQPFFTVFQAYIKEKALLNLPILLEENKDLSPEVISFLKTAK